jgi:hypothetical protein
MYRGGQEPAANGAAASTFSSAPPAVRTQSPQAVTGTDGIPQNPESSEFSTEKSAHMPASLLARADIIYPQVLSQHTQKFATTKRDKISDQKEKSIKKNIP